MLKVISAFAILSIVGLAIVIINFLQLGLLDHLSNSKWINILPGVTLAFGILVFTCYILYAKNWKTARSKWNDADCQSNGMPCDKMLTPI